MLTFSFAVLRLLRALWRGLKDPEFQTLFLFVVFILFSGMFFYHNIEGWRYLDAFYFSVATLTTVGYGDFAPHTDLGKLFTIVYLFIGVGVILGFINVVATHTREQNPMKDFVLFGKHGTKRRKASQADL